LINYSNHYLRILDEINPTSGYIPSKVEYVAWYKIHYKTIEQQPYNDFCMQELIWVFHEFKNLVSFLEHEQTITLANNRYKLLNKENEEEVIEWLLDYENVYEYVEQFYCSHFEWEEGKIEGDKIVVSKELGIKIELSDFKEFIVLEETYNPLITEYKNKFCTEELHPFNTSFQIMIEFHQSQQ
jgi:superfamily I DNA and/or RNA helicase